LILEGEGGWAVVLPELDPYRDAVVLMGSLLVADMDFFVTPMDLAGRSMTFGVEIHGWALENLLGNRGVREFSLARPGGSEPAMKGKRVHPARGGPWNVPWGVWIPLVLGALLGLILATFRLGLALAGCAALMVVHGATAHSLLVTHSIWIDLVIPWITAALVLFDGLLQYYRHSYQEANQVRAIFARFVNPDVVRQIIETGMDDLDVLGTNRRITIMFSDIRGFTSISETLSPEAVMGMLNEYFSVMGPIMKKHGGVIDKYIGDAIMGFFGAPIPTTTHPVDAVRAALEMIEANEAIRNSRKDWFRIGFGINTGECLTGVLGERGGHVNYSAIGDAVNLASRLEGLNKEFKTRLLISESTYQEVRDFFETHAVGDVMVKGKAQPVRVFEVLRERTLRSPDRITRTMPVPPIALD